nr:MAG TPA: hypothetical protein [Caudoviricetes sp.]
MILYALKDLATDYYVTRADSFDELNEYTKLFSSKSKAERCLKFNYEGLGYLNNLMVSLVYSILEKKYGVCRGALEVSHKEFVNVADDIKLKVVKVQLNEKRNKKEE